jgi:hypothetical protein
MKSIVLLAALALAGVAHAQTVDVNANANSNAQSNSEAASLSNAQQGQDQRQAQGQDQVQGQQQSANNRQGQAQQQGNSNLVGNANTIVFDNDMPAEQRLKYAPAMSLGVMNPTTPCFATFQGGVSGMGFAVALGGGVIDSECTRRENARMLSALGENASAISLLCGNEEVKKRAPALCGKAGTIAMNVAAAQAEVAAGDTMKGYKEPPKSSKPGDAPKVSKEPQPNAAPVDPAKGDKPAADAPKDSKEAPKGSKDEPTTPAPGPNYRWQNGAWQQVDSALPIERTGVEGRDVIVQNFNAARGR